MAFPIGIDDFNELVESDGFWVDKSLFIKEIIVLKFGTELIFIISFHA